MYTAYIWLFIWNWFYWTLQLVYIKISDFQNRCIG